MKRATVIFLVVVSGATTLAVAQDGSGHGPPKSPIIVSPLPTSPTTAPVPTTSQPKLR
jgi:hypothetical protein